MIEYKLALKFTSFNYKNCRSFLFPKSVLIVLVHVILNFYIDLLSIVGLKHWQTLFGLHSVEIDHHMLMYSRY